MKRAYGLMALLVLLLGLVVLAPAQQETGKDTKAKAQVSESDAYRSAAQIQDPAKKIEALQSFLKDFPGSSLKPLAKLQIFKAMMATGTSEKEFLPVAEEAMTTFPEIPQKVFVLNEVAYTLAEAGKGLDLALKCAEQALARFPAEGEAGQRGEIQDTLGWVHFKRGNYPEAVKLLEQATQSIGEPDVYEHLAQAYEKAGQPDKAIDALVTAVASSRDEASSQRRLSALKAAYSKKNGSEAGLEQRIAEKKLAMLKDRALVKARYEAPAPAWELKDLKGETVRSADLHGKVIVLDWWGSWCPPCRHELPHFQKLYETYKDKGVAFIGMNWEQDGPKAERIERARKFLTENKYTFPVVLDHDMKAGIDYKVDGIFPTVFVIDRSGQIRYRNVGFSPDIPNILEMQIQTELAREN